MNNLKKEQVNRKYSLNKGIVWGFLVLLFFFFIFFFFFNNHFFIQDPKKIRQKAKIGLYWESYSKTIYDNEVSLNDFAMFLISHQTELPKNKKINFTPEAITILDIDQSLKDSLTNLIIPLSNSIFKNFTIRPSYESNAVSRIELNLDKKKRFYYLSHYLYFGKDLETTNYFETVADVQKKYKKINDVIYYLILADPDYGL